MLPVAWKTTRLPTSTAWSAKRCMKSERATPASTAAGTPYFHCSRCPFKHDEQLPVQIIHRVVLFANASRLFWISAFAQHFLCAIAQIRSNSTHFSEAAVDFLGQYMLGDTAVGQFSPGIRGQRTHTFHVSDGLNRADDSPQLTCYRLLQRQQRNAVLFGLW